MIPYSDEYDEFHDEVDYCEHEKHIPPEIIGVFMRDAANREKGIVVPNTIGADYFFLNEFLTEDMEFDFSFIEQDFLKNCFHRIHEYEVQIWYGDDSIRECGSKNFAKKRILTLMYNGAKSGDQYCIEMLKYLYKIYFKQEYKQLKHFSRISLSELFSLAEDEFGEVTYTKLGRIMGMCLFMGIELDDNCSVLYILLENERKRWLESDKAEEEYDYKADGLQFNQCLEQVETWTDSECKLPYHKQNKIYWKIDKYVGSLLESWGYTNDYVYLSLDNYMGLKIQYARTLCSLKKLYPKKEFTFEEVQRYAQIYTLTTCLVNIAESYEVAVEELLGDDTKGEFYEEELEEMIYRPGTVSADSSAAGKQKVIRKEKKKSAKLKEHAEKPDVSDEIYIREIEELRKKVNEQEKEISHLRVAYRTAKKSQDEMISVIRKNKGEREELISLRNFVYNLEQGEIECDNITVDLMREKIADKKIAIVGGHISWKNKLEQLFPAWKVIHPDAYKKVDGRMLDDMEMVFFFTDYLNHISYGKFIAAVRERHIPFSYLHGRNIELVIKQVYEAVL